MPASRIVHALNDLAREVESLAPGARFDLVLPADAFRAVAGEVASQLEQQLDGNADWLGMGNFTIRATDG